MIQKR